MMLMMHKQLLILFSKTGMLQLYPPYKNLVPEIPIVGKEKVTRARPNFNELVDTTMIFFVEEVDPRHHE
jgi:hypothetical protein